MPIVQIIAKEPVHYVLNNYQRTEFAPNEFYQVPDYAAKAMIARGWARLVNTDELDKIRR